MAQTRAWKAPSMCQAGALTRGLWCLQGHHRGRGRRDLGTATHFEVHYHRELESLCLQETPVHLLVLYGSKIRGMAGQQKPHPETQIWELVLCLLLLPKKEEKWLWPPFLLPFKDHLNLSVITMESENASRTLLARVSEKGSSQAPWPLQCKEELEECSKMDAIRQIQQKRQGTFLQ